MNFRTINDMNMLIRSRFYKIPEDVELVVGIPRSGMLAAAMLALYMNKPLTDINSLLCDETYNLTDQSHRISEKEYTNDLNRYRKILLVDDSCNTGRSMSEIKTRLRAADTDVEVIYACVYTTEYAMQFVDVYFEQVEQPRVFEWNIMNHPYIEASCLDMDGVLCVDPTEEENDDGERYIEFIRNAKPLHIPSFSIGAIVTSRLEKYRNETEAWLAKHSVTYQNLIMLNLKSKEERIRMNAHATFKAMVYQKIESAVLFIESNPGQAREIAEITKRPVYCVESNEFIDADGSRQDNRISKEEHIGLMEQVKKLLCMHKDMAQGILQERIPESERSECMGRLLDSWDDIIDMFLEIYREKDVRPFIEERTALRKMQDEKNFIGCAEILLQLAGIAETFMDMEHEELFGGK